MILISHRGNLSGPNPERENRPDYLLSAIQAGFDVEIDVWFIDDKFYLGHDDPRHEVDSEFLKDNNFWCHAKNINALYEMLKFEEIHCFWHQNDDAALTSRGYIWTYPGKELTSHSIVVMPEKYLEKWWRYKFMETAGICSDFIERYPELI